MVGFAPLGPPYAGAAAGLLPGRKASDQTYH